MRISEEDRALLLDPVGTFPRSSTAAVAGTVLGGYRALVDQGDPGVAREAVESALEVSPSYPPAVVLEAQASFVEGKPLDARARVWPVVEEFPDYAAAQVLFGAAAEATGNLPQAYGAYLAAAEQAPVAAARAEQIGPRAVEIVLLRLDDALARGRLEVAEEEVARLTGWEPDGLGTLLAGRRLALAVEDSEAELEVLRRLTPRLEALEPEDLAALTAGLEDDGADPGVVLRERRGELELEVGDAQAGLSIFRNLYRQHPDDPRFERRLEQAEFRWRMTLLPPEVESLRRVPEIRRSELAVLLYWLAPGVRRGSGRGGLIASDILDDPYREQIARVINHRLMTVDETVHRFHPERPATRAEALNAVLRLLAGGRPPAACLGGAPMVSSPSFAWSCDKAQRCGLLDHHADCLPRAPLSGAEAAELIRRAISESQAAEASATISGRVP